MKGESEDVNLFQDRVQSRAIPGLPKFDLNRVVRPLLLFPLLSLYQGGWPANELCGIGTWLTND